jgi:cobalamin-dependent methionine synthase I
VKAPGRAIIAFTLHSEQHRQLTNALVQATAGSTEKTASFNDGKGALLPVGIGGATLHPRAAAPGVQSARGSGVAAAHVALAASSMKGSW